jgi:hypothetical protein
MSRFAFFGIVALFATPLVAQQTDESFEVEPPLLPQNLKNESVAPTMETPTPISVAHLEKD